MVSKELDIKMEILKNLNTDDSRFLYRICSAYISYNNEMLKLKNTINIEINNQETNIEKGLINLDDIECQKYFNTRMKQNINRIVESIKNVTEKELKTKKNICKKIIYYKKKQNILYKSENNKLDIVDLIKILDKRKIKNIKIIARNINNENIFKYSELTKALEIIKIDNVKIRNEKIYDYVYNYLCKDFISNNYCDFINDKCIAQRHLNFYPFTSKDECCFKEIRKCEHLDKGMCNVECMACRLFACPYLTKRGIGYWAHEFILFDAFFSKKQRKYLVYDFYKTKEQVLEKVTSII